MNNINYEEMLYTHKTNVKNEMNLVTKELKKISDEHDNDKLELDMLNVYKKYYPQLKSFKYGTAEYKEYEQKYLSEVGKKHCAQRHHYNNSKHNHNDTDIDLFDLFEILIDMKQSQLQYQSDNYSPEIIIKNMNNGKLLEIELEELLLNTLKRMDELKNN